MTTFATQSVVWRDFQMAKAQFEQPYYATSIESLLPDAIRTGMQMRQTAEGGWVVERDSRKNNCERARCIFELLGTFTGRHDGHQQFTHACDSKGIGGAMFMQTTTVIVCGSKPEDEPTLLSIMITACSQRCSSLLQSVPHSAPHKLYVRRPSFDALWGSLMLETSGHYNMCISSDQV
jgi:hypothetical protein